MQMETMELPQQPVVRPAAAVSLPALSRKAETTTEHITPQTFDETVTPLWNALRAATAEFPAVTVCGHCGSEKIRWSEFEDRDPETGESFALSGMYCSDCGAMEEPADRNDLAEALLIAGSDPVYNYHRVPDVERRHVMALVSHCLHLMKGGQ